MPVPINDIEREIERTNEVFSLIDNKNVVDSWLWAISNCLAGLLDQHKDCYQLNMLIF
ncbi:MAG: hypothetical protein O7C59_06930 [Rickettsia endosymbiont of Ixodes persulcatus]|nr:hypothetical protein [Rickettsia endosymbiont of Ixodes persulcatus]MCZ6902814.1 hypothetical protein [Rickettsia endosymbiont of Ixodes persulcatus]MCZ6909550.1 hypothetical protein [Rickettsia endosymbiont of Ixodes persulcatus]MCZ6910934.1 hypothetical protein [Rickettsia endosymbiont of Ixodes persulcatus]MCZ6914199.1 hypothetical protein [Rickettsia endosymbiont of Ixodes persulcatus]